MTDKIVVEGDPAGEEKVLVTITSEAFAYVLYKNGRDKWMADYAYLKNNPRAKMTPKYKKDDPSTFKHANKWSNSNTGSMVGAGWHTDALEYFVKKMKDVQEFRNEQELHDYGLYKFAKELIREENMIKDDETGEEPEGGGKKRKRDEGDRSADVVDIMFLDE
jgi:hypothetical protein